jgi:photosystem II stability/assembly factor-like uncharacterized protein
MNKLSYFLMLIFTLLAASSLFAQWTVQNSGIPTDNQVVLAAVNENVCWGVTRDPGVSYATRTTDGGTTWVASNLTSLKSFFSIASLSADTAWIAATGSIYNTINGGVNWTQQLATGPMLIVRFFDSNNGVCIGDGNGVEAEIYTTANGGDTWTKVSSSNIPPLQSEGFIPANAWIVDNSIWAPTNGGSLYKSTNRGLTWDTTRNVVNTGGSYCAFKDTLNGLLCGSLAQVVKRTTDGGTTWDSTETKPQGMSTLFMSYIPGTNATYMICATPPHGPSPGSAYTLDNGETWTVVDFVNHQRAAFVSPSVGWSWGGANVIYKWTGIPLPVENTNEVVQDFHLEQNYPNPFNPSTTINFQVPNASFVNLKVYDVLGDEVAALVKEEKPSGNYEINFNASQLSSGIYFYKLQAGSFVETKKMILLR